jgi:hypothetical protein
MHTLKAMYYSHIYLCQQEFAKISPTNIAGPILSHVAVIFIVVLPCILISSKLLCQQMHSLLKHKMLQLTLKIPLYMAPTRFGPFRPSSGSIRWSLAKVTVFVELLVKIHR